MKIIKFKFGLEQTLFKSPKYLILSIFLFSCSNNNNYCEITPLLPSKTFTEEDQITLPQECINNNSFILDSLLVLFSNSRCNNSMFSIYNKNTFELIRRFGEIGGAPFEFNFPEFYGTCTSAPTLNFIYDLRLGQNKIIDFNKLITGVNATECINSESLSKELVWARELNQLNNDKVAGIDVSLKKGMFFIYDPASGKTVEVPIHPKMKIPEQYRHTYYGHLCANPSKDIIVFASRFFDEILFYNSDGKLLKEHYFSTIKQPILSKQLSSVSNESPVFFMKIYGTPERCYALRIARPFSDFENPKSSIPVQLLSFDWDGNLVAVYEYNRYCDTFCVDESTNTLYWIFDNEEENSQIASNVIRMKLD